MLSPRWRGWPTETEPDSFGSPALSFVLSGLKVYAVDMTTTTAFDQDAARRRRFDGGMDPHGDPDAIIATRRRWVANCDRPEGFCPRCTNGKAVVETVCRPCATGN